MLYKNLSALLIALFISIVFFKFSNYSSIIITPSFNVPNMLPVLINASVNNNPSRKTQIKNNCSLSDFKFKFINSQFIFRVSPVNFPIKGDSYLMLHCVYTELSSLELLELNSLLDLKLKDNSIRSNIIDYLSNIKISSLNSDIFVMMGIFFWNFDHKEITNINPKLILQYDSIDYQLLFYKSIFLFILLYVIFVLLIFNFNFYKNYFYRISNYLLK